MNHHVYCVEGLSGEELSLLINTNHGNVHPADISLSIYERFSVDDVRTWRSGAYQAPVGGDTRVMGIVLRELPAGSQHALLKVFEDPPHGVVFYLSVPHYGVLLPTLRSRLFMTKEKGESEENNKGKEFLKAGGEERKKQIEKLLLKDNAKEEALFLMHGCEHILRSHIKKDSSVRRALHDIAEFRNNIYGASPSLKFMLLHLAVSLPVSR